MIKLVIEGVTLGKKRRAKLFEDFSVPVPSAPDGPPPDSPERDGDGGITLRDLITRVVHHEVAAFEERQNARQFVRALSKEEVQQGTESGKIDSGGSEIEPKAVDPEAAVAVAIEAFEDGLYLVVIDDIERRGLDARVFLHDESKMTFIRLTLLSG